MCELVVFAVVWDDGVPIRLVCAVKQGYRIEVVLVIARVVGRCLLCAHVHGELLCLLHVGAYVR